MNTRTQKQSLLVVAGLCALATLAAGGWAMSDLPTSSHHETRGTVPRVNSPVTPTAPSQNPSQNPAGDAWAMRPLRAAWVDSPKPSPPPRKPRLSRPQPKPVIKQVPKLNLTLVGTIIDSKGRLAIITDPSGKFDIKAVGEALELSPEGVTITKIDSDQVTLSYQGKPWEVTLDRTATSPVPQDAADQPRKRSGGRRRR